MANIRSCSAESVARLIALRKESIEIKRLRKELAHVVFFHPDKLTKKAVKREPPKPKIYKFIPASKPVFREPPVIPDKKTPIIRPKAEYSNSSPYGIAGDFILHPEKYGT